MRIKILTTLLLLCLTLSAAGRTYTISPRNGVHVLDSATVLSHIEFLSSPVCGGRRTGTKGSEEAKAWLIRQYKELGLSPDESFNRGFLSEDGTKGHNIIGFLPGEVTGMQQPYIIVGAHFDGLGTINGTLYPGADSNASGVVSMLSIAGMLNELARVGRRLPKTVIFVAIDGKEMSMGGSRALWDLISSGKLHDPSTGAAVTPDKIALMVNIDQVGCTLSPIKAGQKDYLIMLSEDGTIYRGQLSAAARQYGSPLQLGYDYYGSRDFTRIFLRRIGDQKVFLDHGIRSVVFTSGITMNNNKPYDNAASIDVGILCRRIELMYYWLVKVA